MARLNGPHIPRKRFGQHFLTDKALIDAIIDLIDPQPGEKILGTKEMGDAVVAALKK